MNKMYMGIALATVFSLGVAYFYYLQNTIEKREKTIVIQEATIMSKEIEKNTSMIASEAIGEIREIERSKDVKKPSSIGTHSAIF